MSTALKIQNTHSLITQVSTFSTVNSIQLEVISLFGWNDLPESILNAINNDIKSFATELFSNYSIKSNEYELRKKSVLYWIDQFKLGNCSEQTVLDMLSCN